MTITILLLGLVGGVLVGLLGIGGGVVLVPAMVYLCLVLVAAFFSSHFLCCSSRSASIAQGTSLIALIPPSGMLALLVYAKVGFVSWKTGLLLIPGLFLGGFAGGKAAKWIKPQRMRQVLAAMLFVLGAWQAFEAWWR